MRHNGIKVRIPQTGVAVRQNLLERASEESEANAVLGWVYNMSWITDRYRTHRQSEDDVRVRKLGTSTRHILADERNGENGARSWHVRVSFQGALNVGGAEDSEGHAIDLHQAVRLCAAGTHGTHTLSQPPMVADILPLWIQVGSKPPSAKDAPLAPSCLH